MLWCKKKYIWLQNILEQMYNHHLESCPLPSPHILNRGVISDWTLSFGQHVKHITKTAFFQPRYIARLCPSLSFTAAKTHPRIHHFQTGLLQQCPLWLIIHDTHKTHSRTTSPPSFRTSTGSLSLSESTSNLSSSPTNPSTTGLLAKLPITAHSHPHHPTFNVSLKTHLFKTAYHFIPPLLICPFMCFCFAGFFCEASMGILKSTT